MVEEVSLWAYVQGHHLVEGQGGLGSTKKIVDRLVKIGAVKRVEGMGRSVRPTYISFRDIE